MVGLTTKVAALPSEVPPQLLVDQRRVAPEPPLAVNVTELPEQIVLEAAVIDTGATGVAATEIVICAQLDGAHGAVSHRQ